MECKCIKSLAWSEIVLLKAMSESVECGKEAKVPSKKLLE
jgi:hypothetical protein